MSVAGLATRVALPLAAAVAVAAGSPAGARAFPVRVPDALSGEIVIPAAPRRIVSLAPSVTEILFALGLDREVVGLSDADDYPPDKVHGRTRVGGVIINLERVIALRPDLIVGMPALQRDHLLRLRALQQPVLAVDAESIAGTLQQIRLLGLATGRLPQAEALAREIGRRLGAVPPATPWRVYVEVWHEPVLVAAGGTLVDDVVGRAGGRNIFADRQGYVSVALETVLVRNPQVILLLYQGPEQARARAGWRDTDAARAGRVYEVPPALVTRPGPRIAEGLALVARLLRDRR
ncbi:MAG: helical backbone metal receptor [Armatimonadota bacterium]|nr:helical backbone metal receptor [Armatimonadota bacterium]